MNERIEKLARLAGGKSTYGTLSGPIVPPPPGWFDHTTVNLEKFAELLIKECATVAYAYEPTELYATEIANAITKHFGVE